MIGNRKETVVRELMTGKPPSSTHPSSTRFSVAQRGEWGRMTIMYMHTIALDRSEKDKSWPFD